MRQALKLLEVLADGKFHSGQCLGDRLGISRAAVWKHIKALERLGVDCFAVPGKGYRIASPVELLDERRIRASLKGVSENLLAALEILHDVPSTNRYLLDSVNKIPRSGHACFAERQTAGRGRRGRVWVSPFGRNIYLSVYWRFQSGAIELSALALAMGVAVARTVIALGGRNVGLKWPNDVYWCDRKLAGILLEMTGESQGPYHAVIGIGLNVNMNSDTALTVDIQQPWVDLHTVAGRPLSRNAVASVLLGETLSTLHAYQHHGFAPFHRDWSQLDICAGRRVTLTSAVETVVGLAHGVDDTGALVFSSDGRQRRIHSGEVSLRPVE